LTNAAKQKRKPKGYEQVAVFLHCSDEVDWFVNLTCTLSPSSVIWYCAKGDDALRLRRRFDVTLAMHHRLRAQWPYRADEHPAACTRDDLFSSHISPQMPSGQFICSNACPGALVVCTV